MIDELLTFKDRAERIDAELEKFQADVHAVAAELAEELNRINQKDYRIEVMGKPSEELASFCEFDFYINKDSIRQYVTTSSLDDFNSSTIDSVLEALDSRNDYLSSDFYR